MKYFNRKIRNAIFMLVVCLVAFIGFSKAGIFFSQEETDVVTISATEKKFDPNNYVAAMKTYAESTTTTTTKTANNNWNGDVLSKSKGAIVGPSGKETYYNLNMSSVVRAMRNIGYSEEEYPYWVREDGVKMLGKYVMVAANYDIRPKGTIIQSSLGEAIVCDTGGFAKRNATQIDIAVSWR